MPAERRWKFIAFAAITLLVLFVIGTAVFVIKAKSESDSGATRAIEAGISDPIAADRQRLEQQMQGWDVASRTKSPDGHYECIIRTLPQDNNGGFSDIVQQELWVYDNSTHTMKKLAQTVFNSDNGMRQMVNGFSNIIWAQDNRTILYLTKAWATSNAVRKLDVITGDDVLVTDGNTLEIVPSGQYAGFLVVKKHKYRTEGGSYDWYWLVDMNGNTIGLVGENTDRFLASGRLLEEAAVSNDEDVARVIRQSFSQYPDARPLTLNDYDKLPTNYSQESIANLKNMARDNNAQYVLRGDFNHNGRPEIAVSGLLTPQSTRGSCKSFIIVAEKQRDNSYILVYAEEKKFNMVPALSSNEQGISIVWEFGSGFVSLLRWNGQLYVQDNSVAN